MIFVIRYNQFLVTSRSITNNLFRNISFHFRRRRDGISKTILFRVFVCLGARQKLHQAGTAISHMFSSAINTQLHS